MSETPTPRRQRLSLPESALRLGQDLLCGLGGLLTLWRLPIAVRRELSLQFQSTGLHAIPATLCLALATALIFVIQTSALHLPAAADHLALLAVVLVRELGPLLAALVVLARSGTAITTELALRRLLPDPSASGSDHADDQDLMLPRLCGLALAQICLCQLLIAATLAGLFLFQPLAAQPLSNGEALAPAEFLARISARLDGSDFAVVLAKSFIPGLLIAAITARAGLDCPDLAALSRTVARASIRSFLAIILWCAAITWAVY